VNIRDIERKGESLLQPVDLTGAVILLSREVLQDKQIRYSPHILGEDGGWAETVFKAGYRMYIDLDTYNQHIMSERCLGLFKEGKLK
jgi:hypothetical protein